MILSNWLDFGDTIDGAGRRKDDFPYSARKHCVQQIQCVNNVIPEILLGILDRLTNIGTGGKMNDGLNLILGSAAPDQPSIIEICLDKPCLAHRPAVTHGQIIQYDRIETGVGK